MLAVSQVEEESVHFNHQLFRLAAIEMHLMRVEGGNPVTPLPAFGVYRFRGGVKIYENLIYWFFVIHLLYQGLRDQPQAVITHERIQAEIDKAG